MTEIVKEFKTMDGLGAMLWKKIYAMCYSKYYGKLFQNTPIDWFLIHESDNIVDESDPKYLDLLNKFNNVLYNPWANIDFEQIPYKRLCTNVGAGAEAPGFAKHDYDKDFIKEGPTFNKFVNATHNSIVIHIRRGNAIPENPRYVPDEFYENVLKQIPEIIDKLKLDNPKIFICTDSTNNNFSPKGFDQERMWHQPHLYKDNSGSYPHTSINADRFKNIIPDIIIKDDMDTYDSFIFMLTAKVLIVGNSAFSQSAGVLSTNSVIGMPEKNGMDHRHNHFKNKVAGLDPSGILMWEPRH
jgi:hypothetical protein